MRPWRVGGIHRKSKYVIELPAGQIDHTSSEVGDQLLVTID
jgi:uncharacterized membrane protein (UPF0127 family)